MKNKTITVDGKEIQMTVFTISPDTITQMERTIAFEDALDDDDSAFEQFMNWETSSSYICDAITEIADGMIDVSTHDLWKNAYNVQEYIEAAISEGLCNLDSRNIDLCRIFQTGEFQYYITALYENITELCRNYVIHSMENVKVAFILLKETDLEKSEIIKNFCMEFEKEVDYYIDDDHNNTFEDLLYQREDLLTDIFSDMMDKFEKYGLIISLEENLEEAIEEWLDENEEYEEYEVIENVKKYFMKYLPQYEVIEVIRKSNHPDDNYLYMVAAKRTDGYYAAWTSWNEITQSLNFGHYDLASLKDCYEVFEKYFHNIHNQNQK